MASLERFVKDGGVLVGQLAIGIADGHGKMLPKGRLDKLFGIKRKDSSIRKQKAYAVSKDNPMALHFPEMPLQHIEVGLSADSATVLATTRESPLPLAFANKYGKGLAVYIACDLSLSYQSLHVSSGDLFGDPAAATYAAQAERFLTEVISKGGLSRTLQLSCQDGKYLRYTKTSSFKNGTLQYFVVLRSPGMVAYFHNGQKYVKLGAKDFFKEPAKVRVRFPSKGYVYEILSDKQFQGMRDEVQTVFTPTTLKLYSLIPYRVAALRLKLTEPRVHPGQLVGYNIQIEIDPQAPSVTPAMPGNHTLRMELIDPDGQTSSIYSRNITAESGKAKGIIPFALSDKKGTWRIRLKDLTSGAKTATSFVVE